jgi:serine/threonine protein phosphatase PrpC
MDQDREIVSETAAEPASPGVQEVGDELLAAAVPEAPEEIGAEKAGDFASAESPEEPVAAEVGAQGDVQELADAGLLPWEDREEEPVPLELGTVVNGRYQVIEVLSEQGGEVIYRVRDLQRCPQCGFAGNSPDEAFCASCGAALERKPVAMMLERSAEGPGKEIEAQVEDHFAESGQHYWVWREVTKVPIKKEASLAPRLIVGQASDTGRVRALDEDTLFVLIMSCTRESVAYPLALFVVADGMGGHEAGEVASRVAIQTFATVLMHNVFVPELEGHSLSPEAIRDWMVKAVDAANDRVYLERRKRENDMGTTVTAALVKDWTLHLAHVGDCRAYRWSEEGLKQLTTDHSIVAGMIAAGAAAPEEIYTHPQRSVIYRSVGDRPSVEVDTDVMALNPGDRLILCCDGLWEMVRSEGIEDVMLSESDPQRACDILVEQANQAGGVDNISAIVVQL